MCLVCVCLGVWGGVWGVCGGVWGVYVYSRCVCVVFVLLANERTDLKNQIIRSGRVRKKMSYLFTVNTR
jgi:hypothetical protein